MYDDSHWRREIGRYLADMRERNLDREYARQSGKHLGRFRTFCQVQGARSPKLVSTDLIRDFMAQYSTKTASYQRFIYAILRSFLVFVGNPAVLKYRLRARGQARIHVDWLSPEEAEQLLRTPMTIREACIVGLGLLAGYRPVEMIRLTVADTKTAVLTGRLRARGKAGKERAVPLCPDLRSLFDVALKATDAREDESLLGITYPTLRRTLLDTGTRAGRPCSPHTLRRTYARNMWLLGIPLETISELLGHASTDMTRQYAGLNITDMERAMAKYSQTYSIPAR